MKYILETPVRMYIEHKGLAIVRTVPGLLMLLVMLARKIRIACPVFWVPLALYSNQSIFLTLYLIIYEKSNRISN